MSSKKKQTHNFTARLPIQLAARVDFLHLESGIPRSVLVVRALTYLCDNPEAVLGIAGRVKS